MVTKIEVEEKAAWVEVERRAEIWASLIILKADVPALSAAALKCGEALSVYKHLHVKRFTAEMTKKRQKIKVSDEEENLEELP